MMSRKEALELLEKEGVNNFVMEHSLSVNRVAMYVAEKLSEKGIEIDLGLVDVASLLHDVGRARENERTGNTVHNIIGADILDELGESEVALVIKTHDAQFFQELQKWEGKIVNWADKRVQNDQVVSLKDRIADAAERYPAHREEFLAALPYYEKFENEIFGIIEKNKDLKELC